MGIAPAAPVNDSPSWLNRHTSPDAYAAGEPSRPR
ncbi:Uncharacterised protein [Mycobacteroides abscessus subsp. abscessus]|nr:Uncharacterised protein [Mycobacteroides abscessus subsp. abscessus]SIA36995.1 Uncharacterised protein [Mycobacteroides abscessus subsp. abscessus]SKV57448.1 Uncharacterised protein [Mycobacteroides abscessus subsp. abscessus]SKW23998.1 Uncharacterised protein [Mycobacteroides abscessus subsp. abscessus]SKY86503.1 Uncharacterised protein [Mycobacteroides abscessus subsp. abscessus]